MISIRFGLLVFLLTSFQAFALDTYEPYSSGFSDYEIYYTNFDGGNHTISANVGYGGGDYFNPAINPVLGFSSGSSFSALSIMNISNLYKGVFEFDFVPAVGWDFESRINTFTLGFEWTLPLGVITPYLQHAHTFLAEDLGSNASIANLGTAVYLFEGGEAFAQASKAFGNVNFWSYEAGFNYRLVKSMELISSVGYREGFIASLGAIFTLE